MGDVVVLVPPLLIGKVADNPAAVPVVFWLNVGHVKVPVLKFPEVGVPSKGVTSVGDVANTAAPEPVSSVKAVLRFAEVNDPRDVVLPVEVTAPVRSALVVTFPAVRPAAVPVMLVPTRADGVPRAGVTNAGLSANTAAPVPVIAS